MKEEFIKNIPLFAELNDAEQRAISKRMCLESYKANEPLFLSGGDSDTLYLVKEGWVKLSAAGSSGLSANIGSGNLVGDTDFLSGKSHTMSAHATGAVAVWALTSEMLREVINEHIALGLKLSLAFGQGVAQYHQLLAEQLTDIPLLQNLSEQALFQIAQKLTPHRYAPRDTIYRASDAPQGIYFIEVGSVRVLGDTAEDYTELSTGETFGEMAVLSNKPHGYTAQAATDLIAWQLKAADFADLVEALPDLKGGLSRNLTAKLNSADRARATSILQNIPLFADAPAPALTDIANLLMLRHIPANQTVFEQGSPGDAMYILDSGAVDAFNETPGQPTKFLARYAEGDAFGETAILTGKSRDFTALAIADTNLWGLYRTDFDNLLVKYPQLSRALSKSLQAQFDAIDSNGTEIHLQRIAMLGGLSRGQLDELSAYLKPNYYQTDTTIYQEGYPATEMYFIEKGSVEHWVNTPQGSTLLEFFGVGSFFGEVGLISGKGHPATAKATSDTTVWVLDKADFEAFVERYPNLGLTFSRLLSERLEEIMTRIGDVSAQRRGLPARPSVENPPALRPPVPPSAPLRPMPMGSRVPPIAPPTSRPQAAPPPRPVSAHSQHTQGLPPVPPPPMSRPTTQPLPPVAVHSQHTQGLTPVRPAAVHSQHTQGVPPVPAQRVHTQHTQGLTPVRPAAVHSQHTQGVPPVHVQTTQALQPVRPAAAGGQAVHSQHTQAVTPPPPARPSGPPPSRPQESAPRRREVPQPPQKPVPPRGKRKPVAKKGRKGAKVGGQPATPPPNKPTPQPNTPPPSPPRQIATQRETVVEGKPAVVSRNRTRKPEAAAPSPYMAAPANVPPVKEDDTQKETLSMWFAQRSLWAKVRLVFVLMLGTCLCGIVFPYTVINALASTFTDEGARPGDSRPIAAQIQDEGMLVGAVAALPFVETATPTLTHTPTPSATPTASATFTPSPIPTNTNTPTRTPSPTNTPTPINTPTETPLPTNTPTATRPPVTSTPAPPTETPTPEPTATPNVDFRLVSVRELTPCENQGKHHIFVKVQGPNGQGLNDIPVRIGWPGGGVTPVTETKTNLTGQPEPGRLDFAMFKGSYSVEVAAGSSQKAEGITPDFATAQACGENGVAISLFHTSFEVIFERAY